MTPERWARLKRLFAAALKIPAAEREAYVQRECGSDAEFAAELRSLLALTSAASIPPIPPTAVFDAFDDEFDDDGAIKSTLQKALGTDYENLRLIARGGMGAVYRAHSVALDIDVAIKVLRRDLAKFSPAARVRFKREAQICASLTHPGIIRLWSYGEACGLWFFVMTYVPGGTLADRLRLEGPVPSWEARRMLLELTDALEYAHRKHIIHRDIKAANILLENGDIMKPKLADFGISKIQGDPGTLTPTLTAIGTPAYMSPEQLVGDPDIDARSDIFSLGLIGYAMLTGREPFAGIENVAGWRLNNDIEPLDKVAPSVPSGLAAVITRCLQRNRDSRFPDAGSLKKALARAEGVWVWDEVRLIAGFGQYAVLWAFIWTVLALVPNRTPTNIAMLLLVAAMVPLGLVLHLVSTGLGGLTYRELATVACWPPEWWGMWWPPMFRRPEDLWPRLPWQARLSRGVVSLCFIVLPGLILAETRAGIDPATMDAAKFSVLGATVIIMIGTAAWARAQRLPFPDGVRMLLGSTMPAPAWQAPHMARLLAPVRGVRPPHHARPADWMRAIDDLVPMMADVHASLGAAVTIRAHRLLAAIAKCEEEMDRLGVDTNDAEIERLDMKIGELEAEIAVRGSDAQRDLLRLLQAQRAVLIGMRGDRERAQRQRDGLFQLLRRIWLQLVALNERAPDAHAAADVPDPADVLRSLCDEVDEVLLGAPESVPSAAHVARLETASRNQPARAGKARRWAGRAASMFGWLAGRITGLFG